MRNVELKLWPSDNHTLLPSGTLSLLPFSSRVGQGWVYGQGGEWSGFHKHDTLEH